MYYDTREALRWLILPALPSHEEQALSRADDVMASFGLEEADRAAWLREQVADWQGGSLSTRLKKVVQEFIIAAHPCHGLLVANRYFDLYSQLRGNFRMAHDTARHLLSHIFLMYELAMRDQMAASQVSAVLETRDASIGASWREVQLVLRALGCSQELTVLQIEAQHNEDMAAEVLYFADSPFSDVAEILQENARNLGFPFDLRELINTLFCPFTQDCHVPYLIILHYQCAAIEFYDSCPSYLYEFSPRGRACSWLMHRYPFAGTGNAFLNNAKSVERCDLTWARSKDPSFLARAKALAAVFAGLERMGFSAKRELAMLIRRWLSRIIRAKCEDVTPITAVPESLEKCLGLFEAVSARNTSTRGIIEQRFVDAYAALTHRAEDGWHSRGLGDSVNATNLSRRKIGDCDFQHVDRKRAIGYETHAGVLSEVYLKEHLRTLQKSLPFRLEEWRTYSEPDEWQLTIVFVAFGFKAGLPSSCKLSNIDIELRYVLFQDLASEVASHDECEVIDALEKFIFIPLNRDNTPQFVRDVYNSLR